MTSNLSLQSTLESLLSDPAKVDMKLGERMKHYEEMLEVRIPKHHPFLIRLDGDNFSSFTKHLRQPFDQNFVKAMALTMTDLLQEYGAQTAYTHSDEITLVFAAAASSSVDAANVDNDEAKSAGEHLFRGRVSKLLSEIASYCSVRFGHHLYTVLKADTTRFEYGSLMQLFGKSVLHFDARAIVFPMDKQYEITNHMIWRSMRDCPKNCVSKLAEQFYSHKQLLNKNSLERIEMLAEKHVAYHEYPVYLRHGLYCKKESEKTVVTYKALLIHKFRENIANLLTAKTWMDTSDTEDFEEVSISLDSIAN